MATRPPRHRPHPSPAHPHATRASSARRGYGRRWRAYRAWFLEQPGNQICVECRHELATVVDHKVPHRGDPILFWEPSNHQALCATCHNRKTGGGQ